jgi:hypothetical protein
MTDERKDLPPANSAAFLDKVREVLSTYLGKRGDVLDRGVTLRDLSDAGMVELSAAYLRGRGRGGSPILGPGQTFDDPTPDLTPPPSPTGASVLAGVVTLLLRVDYGMYTQGHGHSHTRVYGAIWTEGAKPTFSQAVMITEFSGTTFAYSTNPATEWHIWMKWVTKDGVESTLAAPTGAVNGLVATTGQDVELLLKALTGKITSSELYADLKTRIDLIDGPASDLASVNGRLGIESDARIAAVSAESRNRLDAEQANANALLRSILTDNAGQLAAADSVAIARQELTEQVIAGVSAEAAQRTVLAAKLDTDVSAALAVISLESAARSTAVLAEATQRNLLATQFRGGYTGTDPSQLTEGLLYQERLVRSGVEDSLAQQITLFSASTGEQFDWQSIWYFDSGVEGWTGNGAPTAAAGFLRPADATSGAYVASPAGIAAEGAKYNQSRLRIRKIGSPTFAGWLYWRASGDSTWDAARRVDLVAPTYDAHGIGLITITAPWFGTIDRIRIDLSDAQSADDYFEVDWIAIGRPSPGASSAQLLTETTARADRDTVITGLVTTLSSQVNDATTGLPATRSTLINDYSTTATTKAATATAQRALIANYGTTSSRVYRQPSEPTQGTQTVVLADGTSATRATLVDADVWIDSNDGDKPHVWSGGAWVYTPNASGAANQAYLDSLDTALATATGASTSAVRNAVSQVNDPDTGLLKTRTDMETMQESSATANSATATETRTIRAESEKVSEATLQNILTGNIAETKFSGTLALAREELTTAIEVGLSAEATARQSLAAVVGTNAATLTAEGITRASVDSALSQQLITLTATVGTNAATVTTLENSKIGYCTIGGTASDQTQRSTCEAAGGVWHIGLPMASAVKQVSVSDGATTATLEQRFTAQKDTNGKLLLKASVKLDNNGYVTGWTLNNDGSSGDMAVLSSTFSVGSPGKANLLPFIVRTSATVEGGINIPAGVYMNAAFMVNLEAKSALIKTIVADDISAATLTVYGTANIARIKDNVELQSVGYTAGSAGSGYRLTKDLIELPSTSIRGKLAASQIDASGLDILAADGSVIIGAGASAAASTFAGNASGKVGGVAVATVTAGAAAGTSASNALADATTGLATRLSANAANVLAGPGGLKTGSLVWDTNGNRVSGYGLGITQNGIIAYNSAGTPTITINGATGIVAVAADISGSTGTFAGTVAVGTASSFTAGVGLWASVVSGNPEFRIGNESSFLRWSLSGGLELKQTGIVLRFAVGGDIAHTAYTTYSQEYSLGTKEVQVVSGGTSPYTYAWFLIDRGSDSGGSIFASGSSSSAIFGLTSRLTQGSFASVWARCVVTDSAGRVASIEFGATSTETH